MGIKKKSRYVLMKDVRVMSEDSDKKVHQSIEYHYDSSTVTLSQSLKSHRIYSDWS